MGEETQDGEELSLEQRKDVEEAVEEDAVGYMA